MKRPKPMKKCDIRLPDDLIRLGRQLGQGNLSRGIRKALERAQEGK